MFHTNIQNGHSNIQSGIDVQDMCTKRSEMIGRATQIHYPDNPLYISRGYGQYLYDEQNQQYLDLMNNVAHVGHCHPKVVAAGCQQMATLSTNSRFLHDNILKLAEKVIDTLPEKLKICFFVNSGTEANDLAMRLARTFTKQNDVVVIDDAYHGHSSAVIDISPYKFKYLGPEARKDHVHVVPRPDTYRGLHRGSSNDPKMGEEYANEAIHVINNAVANGRKIGMFIAESVMSCGGQIVLPAGYLSRIYDRVHDLGGVCVADEVQVGLGRSGKNSFWAFQTQDVQPDIVTIGKPFGNGHPVSCVVTTTEIAQSFEDTKVAYFNTFGGNPVSMAIALSVMNVIEEERLVENADVVGNYTLTGLRALQSKFPIIGDVRGSGLFIGIELSKGDRQPATELARQVCNNLRRRHVLVSCDGPGRNVLKLKPPMVVNINDMQYFLDQLEIVLEQLVKE